MLCLPSRDPVPILASFERDNLKQIKTSHTNTLKEVSKQLLSENSVPWELALRALFTKHCNYRLNFLSPLLDKKTPWKEIPHCTVLEKGEEKLLLERDDFSDSPCSLLCSLVPSLSSPIKVTLPSNWGKLCT